jgi:hypothetical protein
VEPFQIHAQKSIGKAIFANLPLRHIRRIPNSRLLRPQWFARLAVRLVAGDFAGLGDGIISVDHYRAGVSLVLRFKNPCLVPLLVGSSMGIYESVEEMPFASAEYGMEGSDLVIWLTHSTERPESEKRLYLEKVLPSDGDLEYERCRRCGTPLVASETFEWEIKEGIIRNRLSGKREVIVSVQSVNAFLRELESELGEDLGNLVYRHQKERDSGKLSVKESSGDMSLDSYLRELALRGYGYPSHFELSSNALWVEVPNPYNPDLYAAKVAALLEYSADGSTDIRWRRRSRRNCSFEVNF